MSQAGAKEIAAADEDFKDWNLAQGLSENENSSTVENSSGVDSDVESDAFATTESEVDSGAEVDTESEAASGSESEADSGSDIDSDSDAEVDDDLMSAA